MNKTYAITLTWKAMNRYPKNARIPIEEIILAVTNVTSLDAWVTGEGAVAELDQVQLSALKEHKDTFIVSPQVLATPF